MRFRVSTHYLLFVALLNFGVALSFVPYVPFLLSIGLSLGEVSLVNAWFLGALLLAEIPTGLFADRVSRPRSVQFGTAIAALSSLLYATASGFMSALIYEVLIGIGLAFMNGAADAWLKQKLEHEPNDRSFETVVAREQMIRAAAFIIGGASGAFSADLWGYRMTWVLSGTFEIVALLWCLHFMKSEQQTTHAQRERPTHGVLMRQALSQLRLHHGLMWAVVVAFAYNLVTPFNHFWSPFVDMHVGKGFLGVAYVILLLPHLTIGYLLPKLRIDPTRHAGLITALIPLALLLAGSSLALLGFLPGVATLIPCVVIHELGRGGYEPLIKIFIQSRIEEQSRATYVSLHSFLAKCGGVIVLFLVWMGTRDLATSERTISLTWLVCGSLLALAALGLWRVRPRT